MKGCVLYNPAAGSASSMSEQLAGNCGFALLQSHSPGDVDALVARACDEGYGLLVAAGGDGTVNRVVHGLMLHKACPTLAILPLGTGNDLARTLAIPVDDPSKAIQTIQRGQARSIDLIQVQMERRDPQWCVNVAAGGFTGQMNEAMTDELKQTWGPLAYLRGAVKALPDLKGYRTTVSYEGGRVAQDVCALNIIVANGRTAGGGTLVAPGANPEDGLLDVVIVRNGTMPELAGVAARLLAAGDYRNSDLVTHRRAAEVAVRSTPGMWFSVDGELIGNEPVIFRVVPRALRVIVGAEYRASGRD
jgi:diacylglycerol kinase (ATP)